MAARRIDMSRWTLLALSAVVLILPASSTSAAKLDFTPMLSLDQVYDTNVFNTTDNEKGDFIFRVTPGVTFSLRTPETTLNLRSSIVIDRYYKYSELNSSDSAITLALESQPPLRINPRLSIAPSGHFVQARNSYLRSQMVPATDPLAPPSIATESTTQKSRDYGAALRASYLLTENTEFSLGGGFNKLQYLDNNTTNVGSRVFSGDTTLMYKFTPVFSSGIFIATSYNTFENGTDSRVYAGGLAGIYRYSPAFVIDARAGASHMKETYSTGAPENTETSPYGALSLIYTRQDLRVALAGKFEQAGGGNLGRTTRRESVSLTVVDQFALNWWIDLFGIYQRNHSLEPNQPGDLSSASGTAKVRYQLYEWLDVHVSGTGYKQTGDEFLGRDLTRYSAFAGVTVGHAFNIY